jgi:MFS family permease
VYVLSTMRRGSGTLLLLGAAHSLNHSLFLVLPPLLENISSDLNASFQTLGAVATVSFLLYGLGSLVGGPLSDRVGEVKIIRLSIALAGASTLVFLLPKGLPSFSAGMWLIALWASFYHPTSNTFVSKLFTENTGGAMGIHGAAGSVGQMFTPTVAYMLGIWVDWRFAFVFFGALSVLTGVIMRSLPEVREPSSVEKIPLISVLKVPNIWILLLYNVFIGLFFRGVELFTPTFLTVVKGFSGQLAAIANSLILLFGVLGQLVGGWAADKYDPSRVIIAASVGILASMLFLLLFPIGSMGVMLFIVIYGVALFGHQPAMTTLLGRVSPRNLMGMAYGVMFFFTFGLGSVSTTIVGYLADAFNLEVAFWVMTLFSVIILIIALTIPKIIEK